MPQRVGGSVGGTVVTGGTVVVVVGASVVGEVQPASANVTANVAVAGSTRVQPSGRGSTQPASGSVIVAVTVTDSPGAYGPAGAAT